MIVPVNADVDKTQYVSKENGQNGFQGGKMIAFRSTHSQHHNGYDDG